MQGLLTIASLFFFLVTSSFAADKPAKETRDLSQYIAIFDLDVVGKVDKDISRPLSDSVRYEIVNSGKYKVMDRGNMDKILKEQAFEMTGTVAKERMVEAGQILGVGKIIIGSIGIVGRTYMLSLSLVNIESGETERVEEDTCKCEIDELIESTKRVANKLITGGQALAFVPIPEPALASQRVEHIPPSPVLPAPVPSGVTYRDPVTGIEFILVKGGCFQMGDVFNDGDREERPVHEVCVDDFYMGRFEVTQGQWKIIKDRNPSKNKGGDLYPVEDVSWNDVGDFLKELNEKTGRFFRLPTEAEWEYAAREGGRKEKWSGTNNESDIIAYAWYDENSQRNTHPVGQKKPNALGIYDMTGNVSEWVEDWYNRSYYEESSRTDPNGPSRGGDRVFRGGSYKDKAKDIRTVKREKKSNRRSDSTIGFRLVLSAR
jgi:formylglycine-generating enzyme